MKIYKLGYHDWEYSDSILLYNDKKEYSDIDFKDLCYDIICEALYNTWCDDQEFIKELIENRGKEHINDIMELYNRDISVINYSEIHLQVVEKLKSYGFKPFIEDVLLDFSASTGILKNDTIKNKYKIFERKQKIKNIINNQI